MSLKLNPHGTKVKLQKQEMQELMIYLNKCSISGFTGVNYYTRINREREYFFRWHLIEFTEKVTNKLLSIHHEAPDKKVTLTVREPEQHALSAMFKRVECSPYMLDLQRKFINGLTQIPIA